MILRRALLEDIPEMVLTERACFGLEAWTAAMIREEFEAQGVAVWVALLSDAIRGHILMRYVASEGEVLNLAVRPEDRRRGLARSLLAEGETWLLARGAEVCHLEVAANNTPAIGLYSAMGYEPTGRRRAYYPGHIDAILMSRRLPLSSHAPD